MTTYNCGDVVVVDFPWTSGTGSKRRPALVVFDVGDADLVVARLTTQSRQHLCDVALADWSQAGLRAPSIVRLHKLLTIEKVFVQLTMGSITPHDRQSVANALNSMFGKW